MISSLLSKTQLPKNILLLGYGAIGKAFTEILFKNFPEVNLRVLDLNSDPKDSRFQYTQSRITKSSVDSLMNFVEKGDVLVDLSTNIDCLAIWSCCMKKGVMYLNTAMEEWDDSENPISFPQSPDDLYKTTLMYRHDGAKDYGVWNNVQGTTTIFEHGMNPGLISHFVKVGLTDAAAYFLKNRNLAEFSDLDFENIEALLNAKNYTKLAQALGLHTIHCSEKDDQLITNPPKDIKTKFYNTWSCRGFLTEGLVPIQIARGSHEDSQGTDFPRVNNGKLIMSWAPSNHFWGIFFFTNFFPFNI